MSAPIYYASHFTIDDEEAYATYRKLFWETIKDRPGKLIMADDDQETMEGHLPEGRTIMVMFSNEADWRDWYYSDAYQAAREVRKTAVTTLWSGILHGRPE